MASSGASTLSSLALSLAVVLSSGPAAASAGAPPAPVQCGYTGDYVQAKALLDEAEKDIARGAYRDAMRAIDKGLAVLGDRYHTEDIHAIDDTGTALVLSDYELRRGRLASATDLRRGALSSRLSIYRWWLQGGCPHEPA